jgi:hypothetical protein
VAPWVLAWMDAVELAQLLLEAELWLPGLRLVAA